MPNIAKMRAAFAAVCLTVGSLIKDGADGTTCYCGAGALLHGAGVTDAELRVRQSGYDEDMFEPTWDQCKALMRSTYDIDDDDIKDLVYANDDGAFDEAAIRARLNAVLNTLEHAT